MKKLKLFLSLFVLAFSTLAQQPIELYKTGAFIKVIKVGSYEMVFNAAHTTYQAYNDNVVLIDALRNVNKVLYYNTLTDSSGVYRGEKADIIAFLDYNLSASKLEEDGALSTNLQDQTTDAIFAEFNQVQYSTTLADTVAVNDSKIVLTDITGAIDGKYIILFDPNSERFSTFYQIGAPSGDTIFLDRLIDFKYPAGTFIDIAITNMNVDGSVTPQIFGLRGVGTPEGVEITFDVTRLMFGMATATAVDLATFGDLLRLTNGVQIRTRNGRYKNLFNFKSNGELAALCYDWNPYAATNPVQGQDGFVARLTFGGQNKIGVVIRLPIGTDLEIIIRDDLRLLTRFGVIAEGHITN